MDAEGEWCGVRLKASCCGVASSLHFRFRAEFSTHSSHLVHISSIAIATLQIKDDDVNREASEADDEHDMVSLCLILFLVQFSFAPLRRSP